VTNTRAFVILADESAAWKIAGLRQLDRLVLAINEFCNSSAAESQLDIIVFWKPETPLSERWLPPSKGVIRLFDNNQRQLDFGARILSTRLLVGRAVLSEFMAEVRNVEAVARTTDERRLWTETWHDFEVACQSASARQKVSPAWRYLNAFDEIPRSERAFLRRVGKPQDGIVSRFINRPISRTITRVLLRYRITPAAWTISMLVLPVAAFFILLRGDYFAFVAGVTIFQIYSVVDGCDGEIARAKYLESEKGGRLDTWTDIFGGFIFIFGLGYGLYRKHSATATAWHYVIQAIACVLLIAINEWRLRGRRSEDVSADALVPTLYPRHQELIQHSGILLLGERLVWWLVQFTKRDISIFVFFLLAVVSRPEWILPLWIAATAGVLVLAEIARWKRARSSLRDRPR
jgi:phosphatidylglycerophosphate synthase